MAITMTVCAAIGAAIASSVAVGVVMGACIGAMLALTVLYKIDFTVKPIARLFGITDKDVITGYASVTRIYEDTFPKEVQTKLILQYVKEQQSAKEYLLGYAQYGDNQFRLFKSGCDSYLESFTKPYNEKIETLTKEIEELSKHDDNPTTHATIVLKQEQLDKAKEDKDQYKVEVVVSANSLSKNTIIKLLKADIHVTGDILIDSAYITNPDDPIWCKYQLQLLYGSYNYKTDRITIDGVEYQYLSEEYNEESDTFTVTLFNLKRIDTEDPITHNIITTFEKEYKTVEVDNYLGTTFYLVIRYNIKNDSYAWIKPIQEKKNNSDTTTYVYIDANGTEHQLKTNEGKSYINTYPVVCFKHNDNYVTDYDSITDDPYITEEIYKGTKKILKKIGLNLESLVDKFKESPDSDKVTHAFFAWGIPFTARTEKDKDNKDFKEPKVLSKVLYNIFDTLNNNMAFPTMDLTTSMDTENQPTASLTYTQNPYYSALIWVPMQDVEANEVIGNPGTYRHVASSIETRQIKTTTVLWYDKETNYDPDGTYTPFYKYRYSTDTNVIGNGITWNKTKGDTQYLTSTGIDLYGSYVTEERGDNSYTTRTSALPYAVIGNKVRVPIRDSEGKLIHGKYSSYYSEYLLITKTENNEEKMYGVLPDKSEHYLTTLHDGMFSVSIHDPDGDYWQDVKYLALEDYVLSEYVIMEQDIPYETVGVSASAIAMVSMTKQISSTTTNTITIASPAYFTVVSKNSDSATIHADNVLDIDSAVILPLPVDVLKLLTLQEKTELFALSARIVSHVLNKQHLKWYQTEEYASFTKVVSVIAIIVITIVTWGTGTKWSTMAFAAMMKTILYKAMIMVGLALVLKGIAMLVKDPVITALLSAAAMVGAAVLSGYVDTGSFTGTLGMNMQTAVNLSLTCIKAVDIGLQKDLQNKTNALESDINAFSSSYEDRMNELNKVAAMLGGSLTASDIVELNNMSFYSNDVEPSLATYSPSIDSRVSLCLEGCYNFDSCYSYPEDCVYESIDFRKQVHNGD